MESIESQPQNPEFRIHPTNFHPYIHDTSSAPLICLHTLIAYITNNLDLDQTTPLGVD